ncbi:PqqD family protein [Streptosporangium sp. NPDC049376]|uniref:PqqD family protein n=1 Tax=Streptosporangium sp. NPDC049376 TaxID=3366192 RepID=UPI0037AC7EEE
MSPTQVQTESSSETLSGRVLERSDDVLWSVAPDGAVLHNVTTGRYLVLDAGGYATWAYLDGARTVDDVIARVHAVSQQSAETIRGLVHALWAHGFVGERGPDSACGGGEP